MKKPILPPAYFLTALVSMIAFHFALPLSTLVQGPYRLIGLVFIAVGAVFNFWSDGQFKKAQTTVKPFEKSSNLVTSGAFRFSRNPMYFGMTTLLFGLAIVLGSSFPFFIAAVFPVVIQFRFIRVEEQMMIETFGDEFLQYRHEVRRWI